MSYIIRNMKPEEMKLAVDMAAAEGWNPGLHDAGCFYNTDPNGFFVGELNGEIIAVKSAVRYGNEFGFMGFYIVKKEYRGSGYGYKLWQHAYNYVSNIISGMDGVVEQQANYMKSGYKLFYKQNRFEGKNLKGKTDSSLKDLKDVPVDTLVNYDASVFPARRDSFLKSWVAQPESLTKIAEGDKGIKGYGMIRKCVKGFKIGPLFAEDEGTAEKIFLSLSEFADGAEVYLDVPEVNLKGNALKDKYGMKYVFETARMYNNGKPEDHTDKVFGVTTFELG